ncbi:uncharacterized protein YALI1_E04910g [Yarrowia lipolytica]|uniref:Uncharacterized protein n=1 Tax=Yarrowia lipolytica TaxID=4952 RepID=A0A1D8NH27_YARLL|nr:hypothetical protein YALI1_E04910g [Yarrowia lipolytica]
MCVASVGVWRRGKVTGVLADVAMLRMRSSCRMRTLGSCIWCCGRSPLVVFRLVVWFVRLPKARLWSIVMSRGVFSCSPTEWQR